jgi:hypothetical protein
VGSCGCDESPELIHLRIFCLIMMVYAVFSESKSTSQLSK